MRGKAQLATSEAVYQQLTGKAPGQLQRPSPLIRLVPNSIASANAIAIREHPAIKATEYAVDAQAYAVKVAEGSFLPGVSTSASASRSDGRRNGSSFDSNNASISATLSVPIYQGGRASAQLRQSKEQLGKARIDVDVAREQVISAVARAFKLSVCACVCCR